MPITCQVVTKTYYVHVIGPLRAYYVTHVTRYLKASSNGLYYVHVIDLVHMLHCPSLSGKFMQIWTFYYLPPKAGFNWRGPARR